MRKAAIYRNGIFAGVLMEENRYSYVFRYDSNYLNDKNTPAVSLTLPKVQSEYRSAFLFPFFSNLLSEGVNRKLQSTQLKMDEKDDFGLLLATARYDTIGAVTVQPIESV